MKGYASQTTIHGFSYILEGQIAIERVLWAGVVILALFFTALQTSTLYKEWQEEPVITTLETIGLPIKDIEFPAVTICPQGTLSGVLDAVLFKQLKAYIINKKLNERARMKRFVSNNTGLESSEDDEKEKPLTIEEMMNEATEFLREIYPGAKTKPTKIVSMMTSEDPEAVLEKEAVILQQEDENECDEKANTKILNQLNKQIKNDPCPNGFTLFRNLFCVNTNEIPMNYTQSKDYCNGMHNSEVLYLDSYEHTALEPLNSIFPFPNLVVDKGKVNIIIHI